MWNWDNVKNHETGHQETSFLEGEYDNLNVKIVSVKNNYSDANGKKVDKPFDQIVFKVINGEHKDKVFSERFYCKVEWRMKALIISTGIFETRADGSKTVPDFFNSTQQLQLKSLYVSTKVNEYNGKEYTQIKKMSSQPLGYSPSPNISGLKDKPNDNFNELNAELTESMPETTPDTKKDIEI